MHLSQPDRPEDFIGESLDASSRSFGWRRALTWVAVVVGLAGLVGACWPRPPRIVVVSIRPDPDDASCRLVTLRLENPTIQPFHMSLDIFPGWMPLPFHRRAVLIDGIWKWTSTTMGTIRDPSWRPNREDGGSNDRFMDSVIGELPALGSYEAVVRLSGPRPQCVRFTLWQTEAGAPWSFALWGYSDEKRATAVWSPVIFPDGVVGPAPPPPGADVDLPESGERF